MGYNYYWFYIQSPAIILIHSPHRLASLQQRFCSGASHACVGRPKAKFSAPKRLKPGMMGKKANLPYGPGYEGSRVAPACQSVFSCVKPGPAPRLSRHGNKWREKKWRIKNREERIKRRNFSVAHLFNFPSKHSKIK